MQQATGISNSAATPGGAETSAPGELAAWLAKYGPVEREIMEARERRLANRARRLAEEAGDFGGLCEATEGLAVVWRREGWSVREMVRWADGDVLTMMALAKWLRRDATRLIDRERGRLRRPLYYARERARREALAQERRRVCKRRTLNPCPAREDILEAWLRRRDSHEAAVRFGSMVHDLECYVDNSLLRDEGGAIVGRRGGVKAWLQENIPALYVRYTTVMRYKAMAKKLRQLTGLDDPVPAASVLAAPRDSAEAMQPPDGCGTAARDCCSDGKQAGTAPGLAAASGVAPAATISVVPATASDAVHESADISGVVPMTASGVEPELAVVRARAVWLEVVDGVRGSATALMERIDALTDPERVEDAAMLARWRAKYEDEITVRTKSSWWRRLVERREVG